MPGANEKIEKQSRGALCRMYGIKLCSLNAFVAKRGANGKLAPE